MKKIFILLAFILLIISCKKENKAPTANAGIDQSIKEGAIVTLDGSASSDADGDALIYHWTAPPGITLSSQTEAKPTFTAPEISTETKYTFSLVVSDGKAFSIADEVVITVMGPDLSQIENIIGDYRGNYNHEFGWVLYTPKVTISNDNKLIISYWPSGPDSVVLKVDGSQLAIENQIFDIISYGPGVGPYYYKLRLSANGTFEGNRIKMSFLEEQQPKGDTEFKHNDSGTIEIYKQ